ncbi:transporter substrate-binding domain-containing protein [Xylophilus sp. Kf1]|nr:transporter substrate-binding domain-containing protein [Xylophilus sp. Kf1]
MAVSSPRWASLALGGLLALAAVPGTAGMLETVRASQEIVVAHRDASVPFSYLDANAQPVGYSMDICLKVVDAVRRELGMPALKVRLLPVTSASRIGVLSEGRAALECGSTTNTAERRKQVAFTIPHFISAVRLLVRADSGIKGFDGLVGRKVAVTAGTTTVPVIRRLNAEQDLKLNITESRDHAEAFAAVEAGKVDAFALDDVLLFGLRANAARPQAFAVVGKPLSVEPYAIMLPPRDPAFKKVVDQEVRRLIQSGEINALYRRWFQQAIPPKGINLELPMPAMLKDSFRFPSDKVGDLE